LSPMPRTPRAGSIAIGSPPAAPSTRLLHPKKEPGSSDASSARVKKEAVHTRQEGAWRHAGLPRPCQEGARSAGT
jgi:hypothetical protein